MSNKIFISTTADRYGLIRRDNLRNDNPPEYSQTYYNSSYVSRNLPLGQNAGLVNMASDGYGLITKQNQMNNNPPESTGYSKMVIRPSFVVYEGNSVNVKNKSYSTV